MRWQTFVGPPELRVFHFTHVDNVPSLIESGALLADCLLRRTAHAFAEIGNPEIKARRRAVRVPVPPGGVVGDYVPFYFAPQSPMLFQVAGQQAALGAKVQDHLIYLVSKVALLRNHAPLVVTDRNAARVTAEFRADPDDLAESIDWPLMRAQLWRDTEAELDRKERRMAELLVHELVPLEAMVGLVTRSEETASTLRRYVSGSSLGELPLRSYPQWYFDKQGW
ncbi:DUF4433 domain-containing protein [Kutzneria sp. 744]|uniref:type II toxin-antitoxin system toxin DNA ADP-ribosyl transferase DarT n=1 Tax=Kutzneria sp. (strain 744) TaxID=345341 RepID=UPI0003EEBD70|nr:DUF4433 domain-containing protein [Kutzneria sp. 744]EWM14880.1 hypothetical protein KUTG_05184 [Kutzneria sp. 744]